VKNCDRFKIVKKSRILDPSSSVQDTGAEDFQTLGKFNMKERKKERNRMVRIEQEKRRRKSERQTGEST